jgi:hypothetical protein
MHADRGDPVLHGGREPVRRQRARYTEDRQRRALTHPGSALGPPDGRLTLFGGKSGQQVKDRVPAVLIGAQMQSAR